MKNSHLDHLLTRLLSLCSRKFISALLFSIIGVIFVLTDKVPAEIALPLIAAVLGVYGATNVLAKK